MRLRHDHDVFKGDDAHGQHICRVAARIACMRRVAVTRHDSEGVDDVDLEVLSAKVWKTWVAKLDLQDRAALRSWRAGAVSSPTRNQSFRCTSCPWCGTAWASARHLWADCSKFDDHRARLSAAFALDHGWWARQPRVTAKTGWVTYACADSLGARGAAMVAACNSGIEIV